MNPIRYAGIAVRGVDLVAGKLDPALLAATAANALTEDDPPEDGRAWAQVAFGKPRLEHSLDPRYLLYSVPVEASFTTPRPGPSASSMVYEVRVDRRLTRTFYVLADSEDAARYDAEELACDLDEGDFDDPDDDLSVRLAAFRSGIPPVWTGGPGGQWLRYGPERESLLDRFLPRKATA